MKAPSTKNGSPAGGGVPPLSSPVLARLAIDYQVALRAGEDGREYLSSAYLAGLLGVDETLVRKDMASVGIVGRPHAGFSTGEIIHRLQATLGLTQITDAILIGCGSLGTALLRYPGFARYGLRITAAFDSDRARAGQRVGEYVVLPMEKCRSIIETFGIHVAILTVPAGVVQEITDWLVNRGITAIWNFAPVQLKVPRGVVVRNENLAVGLAQLIHSVKRPKEEAAGEPAADTAVRPRR
jgi:redox-sensing transcriptional repressor